MMNLTFIRLNIRVMALLTLASLVFVPGLGQQVNEPQNSDPKWSQPYEPFRIVGNVYYVGTYDLASYLIVTAKGNILINTGLAASESTIKQNIEKLGFKFADTKILLITQAHYDHVGAMAAIRKTTGAKMMVNGKDAAVVADGGASDYEMGKNGPTFVPVNVDRLLKDGDVVELGDMRLVMLHHPGHTKGSCSYSFDVKDEIKIYKVLIANMPSIITGRDFSNIPLYPDIAKDYAYTFESMKNLKFDLWLSSHANQFGLHDKRKPGDAYNPAAFTDRKGYDEALRELEAIYLRKLK